MGNLCTRPRDLGTGRYTNSTSQFCFIRYGMRKGATQIEREIAEILERVPQLQDNPDVAYLLRHPHCHKRLHEILTRGVEQGQARSSPKREDKSRLTRRSEAVIQRASRSPGTIFRSFHPEGSCDRIRTRLKKNDDDSVFSQDVRQRNGVQSIPSLETQTCVTPTGNTRRLTATQRVRSDDSSEIASSPYCYSNKSEKSPGELRLHKNHYGSGSHSAEEQTSIESNRLERRERNEKKDDQVRIADKEEITPQKQTKTSLSTGMKNLTIFAPKICKDINNWVDEDTVWARQIMIVNVDRENFEEMAVRSNNKIGEIRKAYIMQSKCHPSLRFFLASSDYRMMEIKDHKQFCEFQLENNLVYASTMLRHGDFLERIRPVNLR